MPDMESTTATTSSTGVTMVTEMIGVGTYVPPQNREVTPRDGGHSMELVEDVLHKMMRKFDSNNEHIKELRIDLVCIRKKVDTHATSIKHIELQRAQLSTTVNTRQSGTLPSNTV